MVRNIRCEETSHLIFSIAGSPPESPSANPPGAGTIGFETEYQVGHYVPPDIFIGVPASLLLRACYPRPCLVLSDISRREPLETAASLYTVAIGHKEADACRTRDSRFVSMRTATSWIFLGGGCLKSTPEEKVRQRFIETLINEYHLSGEHHPEGGADPTWVEGAPGQGREPGARGHRRLRVQGRLPEP